MKTSLMFVLVVLTGGATAIWNWSEKNESSPESNRGVQVQNSSSHEEGLQDPVQSSQDRQDPQPRVVTTGQFMERKLDAARNIVSGLALEDYEMIAKNAQDLALLSLESQWNVFQTQQYIFMSDEFRGGSKRLREAARAENLDGATLAYFEVTLSCVRCHKYIRQNPGE